MIRRTLADAIKGLVEVPLRQPLPEPRSADIVRPRPRPREQVSVEEAPRPPRPIAPATPSRPVARHPLIATLRSRPGLHQALILSEILGPPKGLRPRGDRMLDL